MKIFTTNLQAYFLNITTIMYVIKKVNEKKKIKLNFKPPLFKTHMMASTDRQISFDNLKKFEYIRNDKPPIGIQISICQDIQ